MVIETGIPSFLEWIQWHGLYWLAVVIGVTVLGVLASYLVAALRHGPGAAWRMTFRVLGQGIVDIVGMSPRRVAALAWLAIKESMRRRVVVVFAVFILVLLFAGWFLDPGTGDPAQLYITFVLTTTSYLVLLLVLFLSSLSLPADIQSKTLHTVVTKPVRSSEIVLGRILGFTAIGTLLLAVMGVVSYFFVVRGLNHTHTINASELAAVSQAPAEGSEGVSLSGLTSRVQNHRHKVLIDASGNGEVEPANGHWHALTVEKSGDQTVYQVGPSQGALLARVPVYGTLRFRDRGGLDSKIGVNVGDEWFYRSYVMGATQAAAVWTFEGISPQKFPDGLPVEMNIAVFRTYKANIEKGVLGSLWLRNPKTGLTVEVDVFESKEFDTKKVFVPRKITSSSTHMIAQRIRKPDGTEVSFPTEMDESLAKKAEFDLYEDLTDNGSVEVWLNCLDPAQYFGVAQPDLYLRAADAPFFLNFAKGYLGIWFQMVLVVGFGVMFSTFLSGPIAMLATLGALLGGMFIDFMWDLARGQTFGGGPIESLYRLVTQQNVMTPLDSGFQSDVTYMVDLVARGFLFVCSSILPPFGQFNYSDYVAYGFDISASLILIRFLTVLGYLVPVFLVGYFFLKTREVAR
jgi:hypothetical protein